MVEKKVLKKVLMPIHGNSQVEIDGKIYRPEKEIGKQGQEVLVLKEVPKTWEKRCERMAEKIAKKADLTKWLAHALLDLPMGHVRKIEEKLKKRKTKIREDKGCYQIFVGGLPIDLKE